MNLANAETLRRIQTVWLEGDPERVLDLCADDVVFHVAGENDTSGVYRGKEAVRGLIPAISGEPDSIRLTIKDVMADDRFGMLFQRLELRGDAQVDFDSVMAAKFDGAGRVREAWYINSSQDAIDSHFT